MKEKGKSVNYIRGDRTVRKRVVYPQILANLDGDIESINATVEHYRGYITKLATRTLHDEYGNTYTYVDEKIERRLELKLITAIISDYKLVSNN
ncbi:helix-turn-helix domain-containing protein [Lachnospiraceae bacterium OttesenSCG-928-D06]|nr:helix-turn-helix domain-containing protein [Lachnospiraceae bacterium OttesenSCG-928-D06]